jgi:hypothetical protein
MPCSELGVRFAFSVSLPKRGCVCGIMTVAVTEDAAKAPSTSVQMCVTRGVFVVFLDTEFMLTLCFNMFTRSWHIYIYSFI